MAAEARTEATALVVVVDVHPVLWEDGAQVRHRAVHLGLGTASPIVPRQLICCRVAD